MAVSTLVPWYGSNRMLAAEVGKAVEGCSWLGVPFAGGMCELAHIKARTVIVGDLHRHVINLASVLSMAKAGAKLIRRLRHIPMHEDALRDAQDWLRAFESSDHPEDTRGMIDMPEDARLRWASSYFEAAWMSRNGTAGTGREFDAGFSVRWEAGGGDSAVRWRSAVEALKAWRVAMARCSFVVMDCFEFLGKVKDRAGHGVYCDPPFPGPGDRYKHPFTEEQQRQLAATLAGFTAARVVCRFYDHPLIRELYPESRWAWRLMTGGKTQTNAAAPEVLLTNRTEGGK